MNEETGNVVRFDDTETAFKMKTDEELKKSAWLFGMMNRHWLVGIGSKVGLAAIRMHLPFVESIVKNTIYEQFCGGTTLLNSEPVINRLSEQNTFTILDYGVEAKETEEDFNNTMNEVIRAIEFASRRKDIPVVSTKVTGMARFGLLESIQRGDTFTKETRAEYKNVLKRIDAVCHTAAQKGISVYIDAEESWIQDPIDHFVNMMMRRYNKERAVVYNTFQMYRKDRLQFLITSFNQAKRGGYILGAKLVRGAYMEKERQRAREMGYPDPINPTKEASDKMYNDGLRFAIDHVDEISFVAGSHNEQSSQLLAQLMDEKGLDRNDRRIWFSQLYGMSDNLSFNLAEAGYNVVKYLPFGPVAETLPYLIRRAEENSAAGGQTSRELNLIEKELHRRGID